MDTQWQLCIRAGIRSELERTTNFGRANDRLSRCTSEVVKCIKEWTEAAERDYAFDYGEFSGAACGRAMTKEAIDIVERYGYSSYDAFINHLQDVVDGKFIYNLGLFMLAEH